LGLVPFGAIGMSLFIFDLYLVGDPGQISDSVIGIMQFISHPGYWRIMGDLFGLSVFAGLFTVPLYTFIQHQAKKGELSRVIAGLNILNALFMVGSAVMLMAFYSFGLSMPTIYGILAGLNLIVAIYIFSVMPEFLLRFIAMLITRVMYRVKIKGHENIPENGGCIITCNHVSYIDWLVACAVINRPVRFVMYYKFYSIPFIHYIFRGGKVIQIAGKNEDEKILNSAMTEIEEGLKAGDIICIFPEGSISSDGKIAGFRTGIESMLKKVPVPVIPMTLNGLWGSFFSRKHGGRALSKPSVLVRNVNSTIEIDFYSPWSPEDVTAKKLEEFTISKMRSE